MNTTNLHDFLKAHDTNISMTAFFSPERMADVYDDPYTSDDYAYNTSIKNSFSKVYGTNSENIYTAVGVLTKNCNSFKNRIDGKIKDNWLSVNTFKSIKDSCIIVLNKMQEILKNKNTDLEDWQKNLINVFQSMENN